MVQNCIQMVYKVQNGLTWFKIVWNSWNGINWFKIIKLVLMVQNGQNGYKIDQVWCKWLKKDENGLKHIKMFLIESKLFKINENVSNFIKMA